jgi:hypothetical protein
MENCEKIIKLMKEAAVIGKKEGFENIFQPGLVKEMVIANRLGHRIIKTKHDSDACNKENQEEKFEYLTCSGNKGSFQFDRMFKTPTEERGKSLNRISRNKHIYCVIFNEHSSLEIEKIYEVDPKVMRLKAEEQLEKSKNNISHLGFTVNWVIKNGKEM